MGQEVTISLTIELTAEETTVLRRYLASSVHFSEHEWRTLRTAIDNLSICEVDFNGRRYTFQRFYATHCISCTTSVGTLEWNAYFGNLGLCPTNFSKASACDDLEQGVGRGTIQRVESIRAALAGERGFKWQIRFWEL